MQPGQSLDTFAKRVEISGGATFSRVRVFMENERARIFSVGPQGLVEERSIEVVDYERGRGRARPAVLTAADGETWTIHRGGCGCGSSLMSLNPRTVSV